MTYTQTEIANMALVRIGQEPILSLEADNKNARIVKLFYENARNYCLKIGSWSFATKRVTLALLEDAPAFGYDNQFSLPADFLDVQRIQDEAGNRITEFKIENNRILTNESFLNLIYTFKATEADDFSPEFIELLWYKILSQITYPILLSDEITKKHEDKYQDLEDQYVTLDDKGQDDIIVETSYWTNQYAEG
jgi:hypothetical protein